jgi:hypothetical protein
MTLPIRHLGGCHCGNLRVSLHLTEDPAEVKLRACGCSFCRGHATRTASDPRGLAEIRATDWSLVERYRFGTRTAGYLICRRCGIYIGAICDTADGPRAVINTNCLDSRASFTMPPAATDHDGEPASARAARRAANWTPVVIHR